ncbi:MAG TPA: methyltransferase domain-containing protein [Geminicoccaceae bacterium]|jgi:SAM-dependent methyltransferase|nr:methyltransferase domain-containing protein [Geminicoccaceae bacterium]
MTESVQGIQPAVFDRRLLRRRRDRVAPALDGFDFLIREAALRLVERLGDVRRAFPLALELGCHTGQLGAALHGSAQVGRLIQADLAHAMVWRAPGERLVADEEALPFGQGCLDLVLSCFSLHWVNDLPGALAQIRYALKPDGLFLAILPGGTTLFELREALLRAELEIAGGAGARVSPFLDVRDAGMLLQRAGFALPVVEVDTITVTYDHPLKLIAELRGMGETNALAQPGRGLGPSTLSLACEIYRDLFGDGGDRIPATFQLLTLSGWAPEPSQPQPIRRGSGQVHLADALGVAPEGLEGKARR